MKYKISEKAGINAPYSAPREVRAKNTSEALALYCKQRTAESLDSERIGTISEIGRGMHKMQVMRGARIFYHYLHVQREGK